jgi:hypothetical protein
MLSLGLPIVLLLRMGRTAWSRRIHFTKFVGALPIIVALLISLAKASVMLLRTAFAVERQAMSRA